MPNEYPIAYGAININEKIREKSRSGGVFRVLAEYTLKQKGTVYGCVIDKNFQVKHTRVTSSDSLDDFYGSKYVQSELGKIFKLVKKDLDSDKHVLFSGTSCQIAGLKRYLGSKYNKILCIDIVCHGVPSPLIFEKYLKSLELKYQGTVTSYNFRDKPKFGWRAHKETIGITKDGRTTYVNSSEYVALFSSNYCLRPACYNCPYKTMEHPGDITIADFWGYEKEISEFGHDNKGVSLILVNNTYGKQIFEEINTALIWKKCAVENVSQPALRAPAKVPRGRDAFWYCVEHYSFENVLKLYTSNSTIARTMRKILSFIRG